MSNLQNCLKVWLTKTGDKRILSFCGLNIVKDLEMISEMDGRKERWRGESDVLTVLLASIFNRMPYALSFSV